MWDLTPINLQKWIEDNRDLLQPPVVNKRIYTETGFVVMIVGGPNSRSDFHDDPGEEFFYQLEGEMELKTIQNGERVAIPIRAGELLLIPPHLHHSPQRFENSVGLVIERPRAPEELDGCIWYCDNCDHKLYEEFFHLENIETQFPPVFDRFLGSLDNRTCDKCGAVAEK